MKSLHVPFGFYPDVVGGTEVYVAALAASLARQNHPAVIAAPGNAATHYVHDGIPVHRFAVDHVTDASQLYDEGDLRAAEGFSRILDREQPDVVHLHAFTRACSVHLVRKARTRGIPVVFTYHTPTVSCARGTLMLWGTTPCDGALHVARCAACALEGRGMPKLLAQLFAHVPTTGLATSAKLSGRAWTAVRFTSLVSVQQSAIRALFKEVDRIVALRGWIAALLVSNGVPATKIVSSKHALCHPLAPRTRTDRIGGPVRVAFMGRLDPTKGVDVLIRAIRLIPRANLLLDVYGAVQGGGGQQELARLRQLAEGDARVAFKPAVDSVAVVGTIAAHDVLAVPSQLMETGPLVVLEAFAAGVPVVGSALGGIAEMVADGTNGLLVGDFRSPRAWADVLVRLCNDAQWLTTLRHRIDAPPTMDEVATEMATIYETVIASRSRPGSMIPSVA
jgi:glycosyltransferase involved in cell wall biosynthesis